MSAGLNHTGACAGAPTRCTGTRGSSGSRARAICQARIECRYFRLFRSRSRRRLRGIRNGVLASWGGGGRERMRIGQRRDVVVDVERRIKTIICRVVGAGFGRCYALPWILRLEVQDWTWVRVDGGEKGLGVGGMGLRHREGEICCSLSARRGDRRITRRRGVNTIQWFAPSLGIWFRS